MDFLAFLHLNHQNKKDSRPLAASTIKTSLRHVGEAIPICTRMNPIMDHRNKLHPSSAHNYPDTRIMTLPRNNNKKSPSITTHSFTYAPSQFIRYITHSPSSHISTPCNHENTPKTKETEEPFFSV